LAYIKNEKIFLNQRHPIPVNLLKLHFSDMHLGCRPCWMWFSQP